jgi:hypothetical protein
MGGIHLDVSGADTETFETASGSATESIAADATGHDAFVAKQPGHVSEIRGSSAKLLALGKHVPEELA